MQRMGVAIAAAVAMLSAVACSSSTDADATSSASYPLDRGVTVRITVPDGWRAESDTQEGSRVRIRPAADSRDRNALDQDYTTISSGADAEPLHFIELSVEDCDGNDRDGWVWDRYEPYESYNPKAHEMRTKADLKVAGGSCLRLQSFDIAHSSPELKTVPVVRELVSSNAITVAQ